MVADRPSLLITTYSFPLSFFPVPISKLYPFSNAASRILAISGATSFGTLPLILISISLQYFDKDLSVDSNLIKSFVSPVFTYFSKASLRSEDNCFAVSTAPSCVADVLL